MEVREALISVFREEELPRSVYYGDGSPIEDSVMAECEIYRKLEVVFTWSKGDILMLDNMLTAHARNPYVGPREIAGSMGEMMTDKDILSEITAKMNSPELDLTSTSLLPFSLLLSGCFQKRLVA